MKIDYDVSKLTWQSLLGDEKLSAATEGLEQVEQVALKVVAVPTSQSAMKTVQRIFAKDRLKPHKRDPKIMHTKIRGGRVWEHRPRGTVLHTVNKGDVCIIPKDFGLLEALPSIRRFVEVAPA